MYRHIMHIVCACLLSIWSVVGVAQAVSLGKIDVASHLGEPFYAEVPLGLDDGESIANVFVSLASASDYRLLEVFHDVAVDAIQVNIKRDQRGARVELTSVQALDLPFFNVIMKVKQGRATHFKKFAVFLDLPKSSPQTHSKAPVKAKPYVAPPQPVQAVKAAPSPSTPVMPHSATVKPLPQTHAPAPTSWARVQRYGPMVFGDTITTVAQRLRVDQRFSNKQVMLALFEKNQSKFGQNNINLIKAGVYLDVPTADEVMLHSDAEAIRILRQHAKAWKKLTQQRRYAKVKEAQENRYTKHVSIGENASGVAKQPTVIKPTESTASKTDASKPTQLAPVHASASGKANASVVENATISLLKKENDDLKQRLSVLEDKLSHQPVALSPAAAASAEQVKKLQIQLARQNGALQKAHQALLEKQGNDGGFGLLTWILIAVVILLAVLVGYLVYMLKGQRKHPVQQQEATSPERELNEPVTSDGFEAPSFDDVELKPEQDSVPADAFDGIPDLTDEDTSEMEAFQNPEEEPDPNVDYLSEADVYTRYGMDDEAEKQVNMALRLRSDNKDAHIKRIEMRQKRGDQEGVNEAVSAAKLALAGSALAMFMESYEALGSEEDSGDDELPTSESVEDSELESNEFDLPDLSDAGEPNAVGDEVSSDDGLDFSSFEMPNMNKDAVLDLSDASDVVENEGDALNLDDISLTDFGSDEGDDLLSGLDNASNDLDVPLLDVSDEDSSSLDDDNSSTLIMDASDDLNLDDISLTDFGSDESDDLLSGLGDASNDLDVPSLDISDEDSSSLDDEDNAEVVMDASDDLNLDDISLTDFGSDESDDLLSGLGDVSNDLDAPSLNISDEDSSSLDDENNATVIMDASDDLNLNDISLMDFDSDEGDSLSGLGDVSNDLDAPSLNIFDEDSSSLDDEDNAEVIMDASDDLNLDDIPLMDFPSGDSDLLSGLGDVSNDLDAPSLDISDEDSSSLDDENNATIIMDALDDLNLDDISPTDFGSMGEQLLSENSTEDEQLLTAFSDLNLNEFDEPDVLPKKETSPTAVSSSEIAGNKTESMNHLISDVDDGLSELTSPDLDEFDDLDLNLDAVNHDADLEEFTSTIQATLKELGVEGNELDSIESEEVHHLEGDWDDLDDLNLNDLEDTSLNKKDTFDESLELDNLLSELDNFSK